MKNMIILYKGKEPRISSKLVADGFGRQHRAITDLIEKYINDFNEFGQIVVEQQSGTGRKDGKGGSKVNAFLLNEDHTFFLGALLRNSKITVSFKKKVVLAFSEARKQLTALKSHKADPAYNEARLTGKTLRLAETDKIKEFVDYAKSQGSQNADKYYMNLSRMVNVALFISEQRFPNMRDVMTTQQLMIVGAADGIVGKAVTDGIAQGIYYKEIYRLAKSRISQFADLYGQSQIVAKQIEMF